MTAMTSMRRWFLVSKLCRCNPTTRGAREDRSKSFPTPMLLVALCSSIRRNKKKLEKGEG
ncbi:hypothetical protein NEUTE1DRAFT_117930 [Neurospora tetrasperma FGSC 2508]|uniref:Uncharacterized protein n=1 Tax=Neurospora tetrasperma (strain FGSC 2508 / ATCC MYA-4615 / P0657) TaxID=510951 RepID=F8MS39_NEUT8|nr:uncharacterized protein NEUTE1DRAFT_117930 [Neurospora tetrasperma FGSC 2508]EGO55833.1 hypothetical protein NEUTE1DRAFT_117930 [Neurospora tetrasperma FGSC 2508]EGZ68910.1 hypothetical protein NEUTE2DRAFT_145361 [Neurospora tetrasperma FGSC 2509]